MNGKLIVTENKRDRVHEILDEITVIGRGPQAQLHLRDPGAAAAHCEIRRTGDGYKLVDLESRAGTQLNGQFVNQEMLRHGDVITVGSTRLTYLGESAADAPPPRQQSQILTQIPTDQEGQPRRFYRHESAPKKVANVTGLVIGIIAVLVGIVAFLVIQAQQTESRADRFREARELIDTGKTVDDMKKAVSMLEGLDPDEFGIGEVAKLEEKAQGRIRRMEKEANRARSLATADPEALWRIGTARIEASMAANDYEDAYAVWQVLESREEVRRKNHVELAAIRQRLNQRAADWARDTLRTAVQHVDRKDFDGARRIYQAVADVGLEPYARDARNALDQLARRR